MRKLTLFILIAVWAAWAAPKDKAAMCSSAKICLYMDIAGCTAAEKRPDPDIKYDSAFCSPYRELKNRGLPLRSTKAFEIYSYLGREYRIIYQAKGVLPVNEDMMVFLFDHMDFTAHLVNAYRNTKYTIQYDSPDRKRFHGDNGSNLSGRFTWVLQDSAGHHKGMRNVFWGSGRTKVLMWKMHGIAVVFLDLYPVDKAHTRYDLRPVVFPANSVLNGIMKMDMFRKVVNEKIMEIVTNIEKASNAYAKGDRAPIAKYKAFQRADLAKQLAQFDAVVKGSGYDLGDAGKARVAAPRKVNPNIPKTRY